MSSVTIEEHKKSLDLILPLNGNKSAGTIMAILNGIMAILLLITLGMGLFYIHDGVQYLLPALILMNFNVYLMWLGMRVWFGKEKIVIGHHYLTWHYDFLIYKTRPKVMNWDSLEIFFRKEKNGSSEFQPEGYVVIRSGSQNFESNVRLNGVQGKQILERVHQFFTRLKEDSHREKDPTSLLYPHKVFGRREMAWLSGPMLN